MFSFSSPSDSKVRLVEHDGASCLFAEAVRRSETLRDDQGNGEDGWVDGFEPLRALGPAPDRGDPQGHHTPAANREERFWHSVLRFRLHCCSFDKEGTQILDGPFSALSTPNFEIEPRVSACFRDHQD